MPWFFLILGALFIVAAQKCKHKELWRLFREDFTGDGNFFYWVLAVIIVVAMGSFKPIRPVSNAFLGLIILVILIAPYRNGRDLFSELRAQIKEGTS